MKTFLLAAGLGTRLRPFTETTAKPAIPFLGLPQILYSYFIAKELGSDEFIYNTHHNPNSVDDVFKNFQINSKSYFESTILNSGGGLSHARASLINEDHFFVMNADTLFIYENTDLLNSIIIKHKSENRLATLFTITKEGCGIDFPGIEFDDDKNLINAGLIKNTYTNLTESESKIKAQNFSHFIGFYIFSNRIFTYLKNEPDNIIYDILLKIQNGPLTQIKVETLPNVNWYELGTIKDYKTSHLMLSKDVDSTKNNSFTRTHKHFKSKYPEIYPYQNKLEQSILRSL